MSEKQDTKLPKDHIQAIVNIGGHSTGFLCSFPDDPCLFFVVSNSHVLKTPSKNRDIFLSCPPNEFYEDGRILHQDSDEVYRHPKENIDLACIVAHQRKYAGKPKSPEKFRVKTLTLKDHFTKPQTPISSSSKLTVVGYPEDESCLYKPLIQEEYLVCDISMEDHHLAIKPSLATGASGSPVFIESDGQFFVLGVVECKKRDGSCSFIIKEHYVSELLVHAASCFKKQDGMRSTRLEKRYFP